MAMVMMTVVVMVMSSAETEFNSGRRAVDNGLSHNRLRHHGDRGRSIYVGWRLLNDLSRHSGGIHVRRRLLLDINVLGWRANWLLNDDGRRGLLCVITHSRKSGDASWRTHK